MLIRKLLSAMIVSTILISIEILLTIIGYHYIHQLNPNEGGEGFLFVVFRLLTIVPFVYFYGIPCSIIIEFIMVKIKKRKGIISFCLYIFFGILFVPSLYYFIYPYKPQLSVSMFLSENMTFIESTASAILFWYFDIKIYNFFREKKCINNDIIKE